MKSYQSVTDALSDLREKGYEDDFTTASFGLYCGDLDMRLDPEDFHVDEIDKVEVHSTAGDGTMIYAISASTGAKGVLVEDADDAQAEKC